MVDEYRVRLAEAMKDAKMSTAALAKAMHISYQGVRKVLTGGQFGTENNAKAAKILKVRSDWLATGKGPKSLAASAPPTGEKKGDFIKALTTEDLELIEHFHHLLPSDRKEAVRRMAEWAAVRKAEREEILAEADLPGIMERAANATRNHKATASVDVDTPALRQKPLPGID
jgi:transcriptional regulator with XRE-family HTH domain